MIIPFKKYHGLGNDFIMMNEQDIQSIDHASLAKQICDRHTGLGADGLIIVATNPLTMIYFNSDGSRAKMCGNGIRCFAKYCQDESIVQGSSFDVETLAGRYSIYIDKFIHVNMKRPSFDTFDIPMKVDSSTYIHQPITYKNKDYLLTSLLMGATHTVIDVDSIDSTDIVGLGQYIQSLDLFPDSTNVNVYEQLSPTRVKLQTYERGAGLTLACGTGATAVFAVLKHTTQINELTCELPLGELYFSTDELGNIIMKGPATFIASGQYQYN